MTVHTFNFNKIKSEYHINLLWMAGRPYILAPLELRVRVVKKRGRGYPYFYIPVPTQIAMALLQKTAPDHVDSIKEKPEEVTSLPVTVILTKAPWYHGLDMTGLTEGLSEKALKEIKALHLDTPPGERPELVAILATRSQIEQLGLDPEKPITLEDIVEAVMRKRSQTKLQAQSTAK
ncbi:MAG: hypothetical protein GSR85_00900 [Desulfurococcales archaeon]|nr:hypothetical protein [Desulfurococcales archaeon]